MSARKALRLLGFCLRRANMQPSHGIIRASRLARRLLRPTSLPYQNAPTHLRSDQPASLLGYTIPRRCLFQNAQNAQQAAVYTVEDQDASSNPQLSFPCLDAVETRSTTLSKKRASSGPEPSYTTGAHSLFHSPQPLLLDWGGLLPGFDVAYETWGALNSDKSNAVLLHTGLSASSHAASTASNSKPGWWEKFIGPGAPLDTNKYFVICTNVIGSCYGSTGPSSFDPGNGRRYATRFPILTMEDMVRAQFRLLDHLGIQKLYASVGSSMGGMQSLAAGVLYPDRVRSIASISGCARSHPYSIALRHTQRQVLMVDPNWARGNYYDGKVPPHAGMKLARQIATVTYRSGPEWEQRFGRRRADPGRPPALCPDFLIETYLDHQGEKWCLEYDPNSLLYISKAMDLFDLGQENQMRLAESRRKHEAQIGERARKGQIQPNDEQGCTLTLPERPYEEQGDPVLSKEKEQMKSAPPASGAKSPSEDLAKGLAPLAGIPTLVMGVESDILFPCWQQREVADTLRRAGNRQVTHVELGEDKSLFGHDTFLLDLENVGGALRNFLG